MKIAFARFIKARRRWRVFQLKTNVLQASGVAARWNLRWIALLRGIILRRSIGACARIRWLDGRRRCITRLSNVPAGTGLIHVARRTLAARVLRAGGLINRRRLVLRHVGTIIPIRAFTTSGHEGQRRHDQ